MEGEIPLLLGLFDHADEASALGLLHACSSETGEITMEYSLPFFAIATSAARLRHG